MDKLTPEQRHKNMKAIRNKDSEIEILLRKALWHKGFRYRKNVKNIFGHPDIAFLGKKVAVFCDSEFWHGYDWEHKNANIKSHRDFWIPKIERKIERDREVNNFLKDQGWTVIRFWGNQIKDNVDACVDQIVRVLEDKSHAI